jgi:hypothetical protein
VKAHLDHDAFGGQVAAQANLENLGRVLLRLTRQTVLALRVFYSDIWDLNRYREYNIEQTDKTIGNISKLDEDVKTGYTLSTSTTNTRNTTGEDVERMDPI